MREGSPPPGSPPPAVRVWGYHPRKIFENSDAKSFILVTTCWEISCYLTTTAKKLGGGNTCVVPQPKSWGDQSPPVPAVVAPMIQTCFRMSLTQISRRHIAETQLRSTSLTVPHNVSFMPETSVTECSQNL